MTPTKAKTWTSKCKWRCSNNNNSFINSSRWHNSNSRCKSKIWQRLPKHRLKIWRQSSKCPMIS